MTRTGISSPTRMSAWPVVERRDDRLRLDVGQVDRLDRLRNVVRVKPPSAVENIRSSAEPMMLLFALRDRGHLVAAEIDDVVFGL